jgi:hypothetical protein
VIQLRALRAEDRVPVGRIFAATQLLGEPLPFQLDGAERYASFALDWYFADGIGDGAVAVDGSGAVVGYCLVCCAPARHQRWLTRRTAHLAAGVIADIARGRVGPQSRRYYRLRLRDAAQLGVSRRATVTAGAAHAHLNVLPGMRDGSVARGLRDHVDERCRRAGIGSWYGEVNAPLGRRAAGLERVVGSVIGRQPNHTFSALLGEPIVRLTMVRRVPPRALQPPATAGMIDTVAPSGTGVSRPWR